MQVYLQSINADFNFVNKCAYDSINFNDLSNANGDTISLYNWAFGDGTFSTDTNPSHIYAVSNNYEVVLIIQSNSGCSDTINKFVDVYPVPTAGFDYYSEEYIIGNTIEYTDLSSDADNWQWAFGDGITSTVQNPQHIYNVEGNYTVVQSVSNSYNCVDTAITDINIKSADEILPPKLPTAFSPNGDNNNDVFYPRGGPFKTMEFRVYNSWGQMIYETTKLDEAWDGTFDGIDQPVGVYIWTVKAVTIDDNEYVKTGDVTLVR